MKCKIRSKKIANRSFDTFDHWNVGGIVRTSWAASTHHFTCKNIVHWHSHWHACFSRQCKKAKILYLIRSKSVNWWKFSDESESSDPPEIAASYLKMFKSFIISILTDQLESFRLYTAVTSLIVPSSHQNWFRSQINVWLKMSEIDRSVDIYC